MYNDQYVQAAYNPHVTHPPVASSSGKGVLTFLVLLIIAGIGFAVWFVFFRQHSKA